MLNINLIFRLKLGRSLTNSVDGEHMAKLKVG